MSPQERIAEIEEAVSTYYNSPIVSRPIRSVIKFRGLSVCFKSVVIRCGFRPSVEQIHALFTDGYSIILSGSTKEQARRFFDKVALNKRGGNQCRSSGSI